MKYIKAMIVCPDECALKTLEHVADLNVFLERNLLISSFEVETDLDSSQYIQMVVNNSLKEKKEKTENPKPSEVKFDWSL